MSHDPVHPEHPTDADLEAFEMNLRALLYRFDCPSADDLRDYYWEMLPPEQTNKIAAHLQICPLCSAEHAEMVAMMALPEPELEPGSSPPQPLAGLRDAAADLVQWGADQLAGLGAASNLLIARLLSPPPVLQPAGVNFRSSEASPLAETRTLTYGLEGGELELTVAPAALQELSLAGQLTLHNGLPGPGKFVLAGDQTTLPALDGLVDEFGAFTVDRVISGYYQLTIVGPSFVIFVPNLTLG
jgi:hypothetical protein